MHQAASAAPISKGRLWAGYILTAIPALLLIASALMKLIKPAAIVEGFAHLGYPQSTMTGIGILELACAILYLVPRTAVLGGILVAAYLGAATATHLRIGEPFYLPVILGVVAWVGLYLRDERLHALVPLRK